MLLHRPCSRLLVAGLIASGLAGCGGSGEIPLAKVPPPPPGFGDKAPTKGTPPGTSPANASMLTK